MNDIIYTPEELDGLSNDQLLDILSKSWNVTDRKFEVWGELPALGDTTFGFLRNPHLVSSGERLYYPVKGLEQESCSFFMAPKDAFACGSKTKKRFVRCELELSVESERIKHKNPLSLCVKPNSTENLSYLPEKIPVDILTDSESSQFISKIIYDFYLERAMGEIDKEIQERKKDFEQKLSEQENAANKSLSDAISSQKAAEHKTDKLSELLSVLNAQKIESEISLQSLRVDRKNIQEDIQQLTNYYTKIETEVNAKIQRLKNYVSEKALFLKNFEFVDEEDIENFLLQSKKQSERVDGLSFKDELNGDYRKAVSYIQAHLAENDILYPRHIIENFITLLRTKDIIILAGDSGSGKTNLVKSFAKAVGGKSIIVPVKPNWTSSEDLMGYYNPLEKKYLATPFLEALIEAQQNPEIPYFICLDEMNLARVEYYFADFLSLLESRDEEPEITLYPESESAHVLSELKAVVDIIQSAKEKYSHEGVVNFIDLLKDEELNSSLRLAFGFSDKDSLIKYHSEIRRMLASVMTMQSSIKMPANVHIIGAINIDETTHYLSPKILDRAHIMRFESPLLSNWREILEQVANYELPDVSRPLLFEIESLGVRENYPKFSWDNEFCQLFVEINKEFFNKLGVEFGMRTIRHGLNYIKLFRDVNDDSEIALNNFLLHKVLPKFTFDGNKTVGEQTKLELIERVFIDRIKLQLLNHENYNPVFSAVHVLDNVIKDAKDNDGIVNFWS